MADPSLDLEDAGNQSLPLPTIAVTYPAPPAHLTLLGRSLPGVRVVAAPPSAPNRRTTLESARVLLSWHWANEIAPAELTSLRSVELVQFLSAGVDHVDFTSMPEGCEAASNAGAYADAMAEHAIALMFGLAKQLLNWHTAMTDGAFPQDHAHTTLVRGATICVIGVGGVGSRVAELAHGLGMRVIGVTRSGTSSHPSLFKTFATSRLIDALSESDFVAICAPLTEATRGLLGRREIGALRQGAVVVNVARAELIDEAALLDRLHDDPSLRVGLDVWWREPFRTGSYDSASPLLTMPNVLATPHIAARAGEDGLLVGVQAAADNIQRFLSGAEITGRVNVNDYSRSPARGAD